MNSLWRDVRFGIRLLMRNPGFTAVAVMAFALGIAANTAIFSVVYATLLAPLPYPEPDQLVMVWSRIQGNRNVTAAGDFLEWKKQATAFQGLNAFSGRGVNLASSERPEQVPATATTPGFLSMMGHRFELGRDFVDEEGTVGREKVVDPHPQVLDGPIRRRSRAGRAPIRIDGSPHTVVGILAPGPADRVQNKLYVPLAFAPEQVNHDFHWLLVMGRLKPGVTLAQATADMKNVTARIAKDVPGLEHGLERERRAAQEQLPQRQHEDGALAAARRRRVRAAHRVRERRQPAARARDRAAAGARGARVGRRVARPRSRAS